MPRLTAAQQLDRTISQLREERQKYLTRLAEIDEIFTRQGISFDVGGAGKRPAAAAAPAPRERGRRRKRGSFAISGEQSVLEFIRKQGKPNAAEVNAHWRGEGRGGKADNALSKLVHEGKLKRLEAKGGERGGRYVVA